MAIPDSTYGQRPGITRQSLQAIQGTEDEYGESFSSAIWGQWRGVFAGLAVIGVLVGGYFAMNKGAARVFDRFWNDTTALPGIDDAYKRSGLADSGGAKDLLLEQVHNECKSRSEYILRSQPRNADVTESFTLAKQVAYLSCLASERPQRFCQAGHRSHLLMAVRDYYRLMGRMRGDRAVAQAVSAAAPVSSATAESDPLVLTALQALVQKGYVARRDLVGAASGWPNDLEAGLSGVAPTQRGCG